MQREKISDPAFQCRADGFQMIGTFGQYEYLSPLLETACDLDCNRFRADGVVCYLPKYILNACFCGQVYPSRHHARRNGQVMWCIVGLGGCVTDRPALHEDDRLLSIAANRRCGEA